MKQERNDALVDELVNVTLGVANCERQLSELKVRQSKIKHEINKLLAGFAEVAK